MGYFLEFLINGIVTGSVYTLIAVGLSLTFSIMKLINFAHGEFYMIGAYASWVIVSHLVDNWWLSFFLVVMGGAALGVLIERVFRPTYGRGLLSQFTISLGLVIIMQDSIIATLGGVTRHVQSIFTTVRQFGNIRITDQRFLIFGLSVATLTALFLFFRYTKTGKAMRATAGNKLAAGMIGIKTNRMAMYAFITGIALAAASGALLAPLYVVQPFMGTRLTGIAFAACVLGGLGSIGGAAIAGFVLGIVESLFAAYVSIEWSYAAIFAVFVAILLFKPLGLFGREVF